MTVRVQLPSIGCYDLFQHPKRLDITVWDDTVLVAQVFPVVLSRPDWDWYARYRGESAVRFPTKEAALAYVCGQPAELEENR